jgi:hypothetical protein
MDGLSPVSSKSISNKSDSYSTVNSASNPEELTSSQLQQMPAPRSVDTVLWNLYTPEERRQLLRDTKEIASKTVDSDTGISPERQKQIDNWLDGNVNAETRLFGIGVDSDGGEKVSAALNGDSELGELSAHEQRYLITASAKAWQQTGNQENIREATENLQSSETRRIVAEVYADPTAQIERIYAGGKKIMTSPEGAAARHEMLKLAVNLDAAAVVETFSGVEGGLGRTIAQVSGHEGQQLRQKLLNVVTSSQVDATSDGVSKMVTAIFLKSNEADFYSASYRKSMSGALAHIMVNRDGVSGQKLQTQISQLQTRYDSILSTSGGRDLLANDKVMPQLRGWAMAEIANNPSLNAASLKDGWESQAISSAYAQPVIDQYQARGVEPQNLGGEALRNTIGQALGITPDRLPSKNESVADQQARLEAGLNHKYYGENKRINTLAATITRVGGDNARVTIMPVSVTSNEFGAATFNVFKVEGLDGKTYYIEDVAPERAYPNLESWKADSKLPPGKMTYVADMAWPSDKSRAQLVTESTAAVTDTLGEWVREVGDDVALGAGIVAGAAIIIGTGGTAAIVVAGVAGAYTTARAGEQLYEDYSYGVDITNLSNPEVRANWIDLAAGTLSFGSMGLAKAATLARGARVSTTLSGSAAGLQIAANTADAAAATNQAVDLAANWDQLSNSQRAMGLLNIAFWGGMTAASTRAGGGTLADSYSFTRLRNNIEFGSPYPVAQNAVMQPGEMRVVYDTGPDGRASNIRIEHGGSTPNPEMLSLHSRAARIMDASGNMFDRIKAQFGADSQPEIIGSAAWEAKIESQKIESEAKSIVTDLNNPALSTSEKAQLETRLEELEVAADVQLARTAEIDQPGNGWVASPSRGSEQAKALGWPDAPEGYTWVAGANEPHLRRLDAEGGRLYFDRTTQTFSETAVTPAMQRVGHGVNDVQWRQDSQGRTVEVTAVLREYHTHAGRSVDELAAQQRSRTQGVEGDHAGHVIGHRFVLDEGLKNMFPQDGNFNTSAYKTMENELADWIAAGGEVRISVELNGYQGGRPDEVVVNYSVINPETGSLVHKERVTFENAVGQTYNRLSNEEIMSRMGHN